MVEGEGAEVTCGIRRTIQPEEYESLQIYVGGMLPCSKDELVSGTGHKLLFAVCRRELQEQLDRGVDGLEETPAKGDKKEPPPDMPPPRGQSRLEDFPKNNTKCSICGAEQYKTADGLLCSGGHRGAEPRRGIE